MRKKKIVSLILVAAIVFVGVSINFSALAGNIGANADKTNVYLTNADLSNFKVGESGQEVKVVKPDVLGTEIESGNVNIWVDSNMLNQGNVKDSLNLAYKNGGRIIIKGDNLNRKEIRNYFGIDTKNTPDVIEKPIENNFRNDKVTYIGSKLIGMMIYQQDGLNNVTSIRGNENDSVDEINEAFYHVCKYDYIALAIGKQKNNIIISAGPLDVSAESYTWNNVGVNTRTEYTSRIYVYSALTLDKNAGNPNGNGQYLFASTYRTDIDVRSSGNPLIQYALTNVNLNNYGESGSAIYQYGPLDQGTPSSATVSFSLPWGISVSFSPQTAITISKTSGGINSTNVAINFTPKTFLNTQAYELTGMWCESSYEAYRSTSYLKTTGSYNITTYQGDYYQGNWHYTTPYSYGPSSTFSVSGY